MTSEIRTNTITSRAGLSTVTFTDSGPMFSGITTFVDNSTFSVGTGGTIHAPATNVMALGTNSIDAIKIDSSGNVNVTGILTASSISGGVSLANGADNRVVTATGAAALTGETYFTWNGNNLAIRGGEGQNCTIELASDEGDDPADFWRMMAQASDNALAIDHYGSGSWVEKVRITSAGKMGVGTDNPNRTLSVKSNGGQFSIIDDDDSKGQFYCNAGTVSIWATGGSSIAGDLDFATTPSGGSTASRMQITSEGQVKLTGNNSGNHMPSFGTNVGGLTIDDVGNQHTGLEVSHGSNKVFLVASSNNSVYMSSYGTGNFVLEHTGSGGTRERLRIDNNGRIRLGGDPSGTTVSALDVTGGTSTIADVMLVKGNAGNGFIRFQDNDNSCNWTLGADDGAGLGANGFILYDRVNSAYRWSVDNSGNMKVWDGNVQLASGHGIDFSATSDGSGSTTQSELFNDYERGTWTPSMNKSGASGSADSQVTNRFGFYVKCGDLLWISFYWYSNNLSFGTGGNNWYIDNLPYNLLTLANSAYQFVPGGYLYTNGHPSAYSAGYRWQSNSTNGADTLYMYGTNGNTNATGGAWEFSGCGTLRVSS